MFKALKRFWKIARYASGDDAYERYRRHHDQAHADAPPLSRKAFWDTELDRKWSGLRRCC
ncbi:MAG: CstA-like transporter-associated (seleno)protein [Gammaproteobacteria bacterium]